MRLRPEVLFLLAKSKRAKRILWFHCEEKLNIEIFDILFLINEKKTRLVVSEFTRIPYLYMIIFYVSYSLWGCNLATATLR